MQRLRAYSCLARSVSRACKEMLRVVKLSVETGGTEKKGDFAFPPYSFPLTLCSVPLTLCPRPRSPFPLPPLVLSSRLDPM